MQLAVTMLNATKHSGMSNLNVGVVADPILEWPSHLIGPHVSVGSFATSTCSSPPPPSTSSASCRH
ncbi:hypothetical protein BLOT_008910 [Blomia tropicalis]|nr:hypothetical protein BLOT_008910 [Blomia tropicalis]